MDTAQKTVLVVTLVVVSLVSSLAAASDAGLSIPGFHPNQLNSLQPNVKVSCATGSYLANHQCVTSCPIGFSPVKWAEGETLVCMSPDGRPVSIFDLVGFQVSSDNGKTVFLVVADVPLTKVSITQQILNGSMWGGYLSVSQSTIASLSEVATIPTITTEVATVGDMAGMFLIQRVDTDSLAGNITFPYPVCCRQQATTIHLGDDVGIGCEGWSEVLVRIDSVNQIAVFTRMTGPRPYGGCPICLSGDSMIETPSGLVNVKTLTVGMLVWTVDKSGNRVEGRVLELSRMPVPVTDEIVHIVLVDGRQLYASASHPTADGRTIGQLRPGDILDGSVVKIVEFVPYSQGYTYDLLPRGDTGDYWANGILIGSTLSRPA